MLLWKQERQVRMKREKGEPDSYTDQGGGCGKSVTEQHCHLNLSRAANGRKEEQTMKG